MERVRISASLLKSSAAEPLPLKPPWAGRGNGWMPLREFARQWNRNARTVQRWCETGSVLYFGIPCYKDPFGRWWLNPPS